MNVVNTLQDKLHVTIKLKSQQKWNIYKN